MVSSRSEIKFAFKTWLMHLVSKLFTRAYDNVYICTTTSAQIEALKNNTNRPQQSNRGEHCIKAACIVVAGWSAKRRSPGYHNTNHSRSFTQTQYPLTPFSSAPHRECESVLYKKVLLIFSRLFQYT